MLKRFKKDKIIFLKWFFLIIVIFALGAGTEYFYLKTTQEKLEKSIYTSFVEEVYSKIQSNYWKKLTDKELSNRFKKEIEAYTNKVQVLPSYNKEGVSKAIRKIIKNKKEKEKKEFVIQLTNSVLKNLEPKGRSKLYSKKQEQKLTQRVKNINPNTKQKEPTVFSKLLKPKILYLYIQKFSPTTLEELNQEAKKVDQGQELDTLILDLRGNVGGSIDLLPYFLGPFIGKNEYAYQWFSQGNYKPFKTKMGWLPSLVRYKKVVVLVNKGTQSSAEVVAATLKKYNVGVTVGTKTRGWGTIEKVFPLDNQLDLKEEYSLFLAHSLTLRNDEKPIEGEGVSPVININHKGWKEKLLAYFHYQDLIETVEEVWNNPPFPSKINPSGSTGQQSSS